MKRIAILGCGPAGLLAAHAAHTLHFEAKVLSLPDKSNIGGAQYLHAQIPGLTDGPDGEVVIYKEGERREYARKVYGDPEAPCSWDLLAVGGHDAWSMSKAYDALWDLYGGDHVEPFEVIPESLDELLDSNEFDLVISTVPKPSICKGNNGHGFLSQRVMFDETPQVKGIDGNYIVYNGWHHTGWYRSSCIFGLVQTEYSAASVEEYETPPVRVGKKPVSNDCTCWSGFKEFLPVGRFGKWEKGVLVHQAFQEALDAMLAL